MPYKGSQQPDLVGLALNLMQMKRDRELDERKLALEEFKAQQMAQSNAIQAQRDDIKWQLDIQRSAMDLDEKMVGREKALAPTMNAANDPRLDNSTRQTAANQFVRGLNQQIAAGRDPEMVGGNVGAEAATMRAKDLSAAPNLDWEYDSAGNKRRVIVGEGGQMTPVPGAVWVPPKAGVTVNVGGDGALDLNQVVAASRDERRDFVERMAPFEAIEKAQSTMKNVRAMADKNGVLPQQASQIIASDAMAALRAEALNEGDVARLTAVGLWNKAYAVLGLPPTMTVEQLDTLSKMLDDKAREAIPKRKSLIKEASFRAKQFGFDPRLVLGEYADNPRAGSGSSKEAEDIRAAREAATTGAPPTDFEYQRAEKNLRQNPKFRTGPIDVNALNEEVRRMRGMAGGN